MQMPEERPGWVCGLAGGGAALAAALVAAVGIRYGTRETWPVVAAAVGLVGFGAGAAVRWFSRRVGQQHVRERAALLDRFERAAGVEPASHFIGASPSERLRRIDASHMQLQQLREVAEGVHGVEALFDPERRLLWISPSIERLTGRAPQECASAADALQLLVHESDQAYCLRMAQRVMEGAAGEDFEMRLKRSDGGFCWVACHWRPVRGADGAPAGLRMSAEDVQARKEAEYKLLETVAELRRAQALREHYLARSNDERQRLAALLNVIRLGILYMDRDHRVLYFNRAMLDIWGFPFDENLIGVRDVVLQSRVAALLEEPEAYFEHLRDVIAQPEVSEPFEIHFRDGRVVTDMSAVVEGAQGHRGIGRVWIYEDVTEQRRIARRLVELAERDPLTDLFNRRRFHEELERLLADAARRGLQVGMVAIDLDGFKPINDEFGHQAGDEVLVGMARRVGSVIRRNELFFRLGGDEFCVLVPDTNVEQLSELAHRIVEGIDALGFEFDGRPVGLTASLGIALFPHHATSGEALMAAADHAMYRSKSGGRNRWSIATVGCGDESVRMQASDVAETKRGEK